ncbi:PEPxxWA-CTERM sorting domain-containing protein [Phenylobacterium sp.]|uniref:PEPxxWA-CTERM sorting domain-containing protein n=1 Tax=Phenylobacterium sp. TaxID=1871053 RepID=UPI0025F4E5C6|nr:PEPxxWA-CTERM sorting domain-containing protein [Phenylobacterium sp.]
MPGCVSNSFKFAGVAAALTLSFAGAAQAGDGSVRPPNYKFNDGSRGFKLSTHGGIVNPGVLVGFNPQPDPPGDGALIGLLSVLDLADPTHPTIHAPLIGGDGYRLQFYHNLADGSVRPIDAPNSDGFTGFSEMFRGHNINVTFQFAPGRVDPGSWVGFNPQPDPPGDGFAQDFHFFGAAPTIGVTSFGRGGGVDTSPKAVVAFSVSVDGDLLSFSATPEPATWAMMLLGFGGAGAVLRQRRRKLVLA